VSAARKKVAKGARRTMYMHTLNGKPASYSPGAQISFTTTGRYARKGVRLAASVAEIKEQRKASDAWRAKKGFRTDLFTYSYVLVEVPS
jgi:hypothetical protein